MLKAFSFTKVPMLFFVNPKVIEITDVKCNIRIPFSKRVKNHLGSMYFGSLSVGADACIGLLATHKISKTNKKVSLVFKSFKADFLKRAEGPTDFICDQGPLIDEMIKETLNSGARVNKVVPAYAVTHGEKVAEFQLELSLKLKI